MPYLNHFADLSDADKLYAYVELAKPVEMLTLYGLAEVSVAEPKLAGLCSASFDGKC